MCSYHTVFYTERFPDKECKNLSKIRLHVQTYACIVICMTAQIVPVLNVFSSRHLRQSFNDNLLQLPVCLERFQAVVVVSEWGSTSRVAVGTAVSAGELGSEPVWKLLKNRQELIQQD